MKVCITYVEKMDISKIVTLILDSEICDNIKTIYIDKINFKNDTHHRSMKNIKTKIEIKYISKTKLLLDGNNIDICISCSRSNVLETKEINKCKYIYLNKNFKVENYNFIKDVLDKKIVTKVVNNTKKVKPPVIKKNPHVNIKKPTLVIKELPYEITRDVDVYIIHSNEFYDRNYIVDNIIKNINESVDDTSFNADINVINSPNTSSIQNSLTEQEEFLKKYDEKLRFDDPDEFSFYKKGQIGCYIGHHLSIKTIMTSGSLSKYSVILEDNVVLKEGFMNYVNKIIDFFENKEETFDIISLLVLNNLCGEDLGCGVFKPSMAGWLFGSSAYIINNLSVSKIYDLNCNILNEIDNHYKMLYDDKKIKLFNTKNSPIGHEKYISKIKL